jgi:hypothetical protein
MGRKKRPAGPAPPPVFFAKKRKLAQATQLSALVALHKYCAAFKLGAPGFRQVGASPCSVCVVMDGAELGRARHAERAGAMERAALLTLQLLDPEAKSLPANVAWPDGAAVAALQLRVVNATPDGPQPPSRPPPAARAPVITAPRAAPPPPPPLPVRPPRPHGRFLDDGSELLWGDEANSVEELRASRRR